MRVVTYLKQAERLRWQLGRPVDSLLIGAYRSWLRGEGVTFADARPYEPGEPWRRIHWSLSARQGRPYVWLGTEERNLPVTLALDHSASMHAYPAKLDLAYLASVILAQTALRQGDAVRWASFTQKVEWFSGFGRTPAAVWSTLETLMNRRPLSTHTRLRPLISWLEALHPRRALLVILTDGFFQDPKYLKNLLALARKHFILLLYVRDPIESLSIRFGQLPYKEVETGKKGVAHGELLPPSLLEPRIRQAVLSKSEPVWQTLQRALTPPLL